jgi:DNA-binding CsgD family transcriptional regulator
MNSIAYAEFSRGVVEQALDLLLSATDAPDLCRRITHADFTGPDCMGAHIYLLDASSHLQLVAGYGVPAPIAANDVSIWDDNALARCVREKCLIFNVDEGSSGEHTLYCVPWLKESAPVGCIVLVMKPGTTEKPFDDSNVPALSKLGAMYVSQIGLNAASGKYSQVAVNPDDLTSRQLTILNLMAEGMVNGEIARQLMLSESTIRQETVRIYRALGVGNRQEASKKGRALGLVQKSAVKQ